MIKDSKVYKAIVAYILIVGLCVLVISGSIYNTLMVNNVKGSGPIICLVFICLGSIGSIFGTICLSLLEFKYLMNRNNKNKNKNNDNDISSKLKEEEPQFENKLSMV